MAQLQRTFKESYVRTLREQVTMGITTRMYAEEQFEFDPTMVRSVANVYHPEGLLEKLNPEATTEADFQSAIALYEAYKNLPPIVASSEAFWVYLTHVDLFSYVQKRYPKVGTPEGGAKYILAHWFRSDKGLMRTSLSNLWWSVYCSVDESRGEDHKYDLTKILFSSAEFRQTRIGVSTLFRHKNALLGILEFFYEHPELVDNHMTARGQRIIVHFNRLGAVKELSCLSKNFFKEECEKRYDILKETTSIVSLFNKEEIFDI